MLFRSPWVLPPVGSLKREPLEAAFERHGVPMPQNRIETASVHMIRIYLQLTDSIAVLAGGVAKHYQALGLLAILPLELPKMVRPVGMMWSRQRPLSPSTRLMMQCLEEATRSDLLLKAERRPRTAAAPGKAGEQPIAVVENVPAKGSSPLVYPRH